MKKFILLRQQMLAKGVDQCEMAYKLGVSKTYICNRLSGRYPFDARDMGIIGEWLRIPQDMYFSYFVKPLIEKNG